MAEGSDTIRSPKQGAHKRGPWYPYYAGYTPGFATDALRVMTAGSSGTVLDPWNGSGTSTTVALSAGHDAVGFDANPALILIARARNVAASTQSLGPLSIEVLEAVARLRPTIRVDDSEPLLTWFKRPAAEELCALREAINLVFVGERQSALELKNISGLAAFYYTAAFEAVRRLLNAFRASNPTWVRRPATGRHRLNPGPEAVQREFLDAVERMVGRLVRQTIPDAGQRPWAEASIEIGDSRSLPLGNDQVDTVLSSPPYCTRIDYVVSARPELAFMGLSEGAVKDLRSNCVGGPVVSRTIHSRVEDVASADVADLLSRIEAHDSKAAKTYYLKYYTNYFADLALSCEELHRVTKPSGKIGLVVQDSYFKDIHIDLQSLLTSVMSGAGRSLERRVDFTVGSTRTTLNPSARVYKKGDGPVESLMVYS